jgi:hypothetical protein
MDAKKAHTILRDREIFPQHDLLFCLETYVHAKRGDTHATIDGIFTADELEAIAAWMRDPDAVTDAK